MMRITKFNALVALAALFLAVVVGPLPAAQAQSRIKDIVQVEGVRKNQLVGYGLVVGLDGTGDELRDVPFTEQSLQSMLERLGVSVRDEDLRTENVAAVMVIADLPPFARQGSLVDVRVAALGDATSLAGGSLLVTPLMGADGEVYAVAQGALTVSAIDAEGNAQEFTQGVPTSGRIANGAVVEKELDDRLNDLTEVRLTLRNPDFTTATRIADVVNARFEQSLAEVLDLNSVEVRIPGAYQGQVARLIQEIEVLPVNPDSVAKVVVDEASGTIVIGADVRVSRVAITQGNLTVRVTETPQVSQPGPFSEAGDTEVVDRTQIDIDDGEPAEFRILGGYTTLEDLVAGLNRLGASPRNIIAILQALKAAGALQAEIEVM